MYLYLKCGSYINKVFQESNVQLLTVIWSSLHMSFIPTSMQNNVERAKTFLASKEETVLDLSAISFGRTLKSTLQHQQDI